MVFALHLSLPIRFAFIPRNLERLDRYSHYLQKRRAESRSSAAFEVPEWDQSSISRCAASAARASEFTRFKNSWVCPLKSPSSMKLLIAPSASSCPGPVGRIIAQGGRLGLMNSHGSGMIRLDCNVSG